MCVLFSPPQILICFEFLPLTRYEFNKKTQIATDRIYFGSILSITA